MLVARFGCRRPERHCRGNDDAAVPLWPAALLGFALVGAGCANVVPVLYSSVGRQTVVPEHVAVSTITMLGYAGILAGPALIGFMAHAISLPAALLILVILQFGIAAAGRRLPT